MSSASSAGPVDLPAVVSRLRAAGCVFAEDEAELLVAEAGTAAELAVLVDRRVAGHPLEHVLGWAEFCGLRIAVEPGVFVPRRRTEFLAREAVDLARHAAGQPPLVVDLCCGSGAVGAVLLRAVAGAEVHAADIEPAAVRCARRNLGPGGRVHLGDLYTALPTALRGRIAVLVANAPYVPTEAVGLLPAEAREHEPLVALDGGADGLDVLRRVAAGAARWLAPGGCLLFEVSDRQVSGAVAMVTGAGLAARVAACDELNATVVTAVRPAAG